MPLHWLGEGDGLGDGDGVGVGVGEAVGEGVGVGVGDGGGGVLPENNVNIILFGEPVPTSVNMSLLAMLTIADETVEGDASGFASR